ncbi:MAG: hypothetical protein PHV34_19510 [Verrucomicrobiae bacterium]|nr:hypothetical protein [Verrucomicrobiae bacterium]
MPNYVIDEKNAINRDRILQALEALGKLMELEEHQPVRLVCCGGAAMNILGTISRLTGDVDVICIAQLIKGRIRLLPGMAVSNEFDKLVGVVARKQGIKETWLNFGPASLLEFGLPPGVENRLKRRAFGKRLIVYFVSRMDQVHLKMLAVMNPGKRQMVHLSDLMELKPRANEVKAAVAWLLKRKTSRPYRKSLAEVLDRIGYEQIAQSIKG